MTTDSIALRSMEKLQNLFLCSDSIVFATCIQIKIGPFLADDNMADVLFCLCARFTEGDECGKRGRGWAVCYLICVPSKPLTVPCPRTDKHSCVCGGQSELERQCRGFSPFSPGCSTALWVDMYKTVWREGKMLWRKVQCNYTPLLSSYLAKEQPEKTFNYQQARDI